jgi:dimethylhistidine N-methyltransferase
MSFLKDVAEGLASNNKFLPSRYFYDAKGDELFQEIMRLPEYYLTNCEYEIFSTKGKEILKAFSNHQKPFDLVEFGAGDGTKTRVLIERLLESGADMRYLPIDISGDVLEGLKDTLSKDIPDLEVLPQNAEYFSALDNIQKHSDRPKLILFIGSSIGNFRDDVIKKFLTEVYDRMNPGDQILVGYDLMKDPNVILKAYNDSRGVTRAFNLNILRRINQELGGDFDLEAFEHYPFYDPITGYAKSYLVSLKTQNVFISDLGQTFSFQTGEVIHTEISRKFRIADIERYFTESGLKVVEHFYDCKHYFVDTLAKKL